MILINGHHQNSSCAPCSPRFQPRTQPLMLTVWLFTTDNRKFSLFTSPLPAKSARNSDETPRTAQVCCGLELIWYSSYIVYLVYHRIYSRLYMFRFIVYYKTVLYISGCTCSVMYRTIRLYRTITSYRMFQSVHVP